MLFTFIISFALATATSAAPAPQAPSPSDKTFKITNFTAEHIPNTTNALFSFLVDGSGCSRTQPSNDNSTIGNFGINSCGGDYLSGLNKNATTGKYDFVVIQPGGITYTASYIMPKKQDVFVAESGGSGHKYEKLTLPRDPMFLKTTMQGPV